MSNKGRLWHIFGPVICAFILLLAVFLFPWDRTFSKESIYEAANSQTQTVFKGVRMKQEAFENGYVPFYGSSELSRFDSLHPSVLATKYHRNYRPFLLGGPGSQSLAQFIGMQGTAKQLRNKKAVVIISPQWFTKRGQDPQAFSLYYSPLNTALFLLKAKNTVADRYAAKRIASMPTVKNGLIKNGLKKIAEGHKLSNLERLLLANRIRILANEDNFFSSFQLRDRINIINKFKKMLPAKYSRSGLEKVAAAEGKANTTSNNLGIDNTFYRTRLPKKVLKRLKGSQKHFDYVRSAEYSDFELLLNQFAKQHTNVLFIIPPVNAKWAKYTGLSQKMYQKSVAKMEKQLTDQGFSYIKDLSKNGAKKYYMTDTIHIGWRGWIDVDSAVRKFMSLPNLRVNYNINNYFFSKKWQNTTKVKSLHLTDKTSLKKNIVKHAINRLNIAGSVLVIHNNKVWLKYATANTPDTSYLINSVQKSMTATMVMRLVERGKLKLTDKLSKFYPAIPGANKVTIKNLLDMSSGLNLKKKQQLGTAVYTSDEADIQANIKKTTFNAKQLNHWHYTSLNYVYLCGILTKIEHKSYEELFRETYIKPLKLKHTEFLWSSLADLQSNSWVPGYNLVNGTFQAIGHDQAVLEARNELGAGSIVMSNGDLAKVIKAILSGKLISKKSQKILFRGYAPSYYAGGFYNALGYKKANGAGDGYCTFLRVSDDGKTMIVVQTNRANMKLFTYYKKHIDVVMQILQDF